MPENFSPQISRIEEAREFISAEGDPEIRFLLEYLLRSLFAQSVSGGAALSSELDTLFVVSAARRMFEGKALISQVLAGNIPEDLDL